MDRAHILQLVNRTPACNETNIQPRVTARMRDLGLRSQTGPTNMMIQPYDITAINEPSADDICSGDDFMIYEHDKHVSDPS